MNQLREIEGKRKERYADLRQIELATLAAAYKRFALLFFSTSLGLALLLGWHMHQSQRQQQQLNHLKQAANDAQWELENSPPPEGTMRAIHLLEGALE